jgi:hypothetical protein
MPKSPLLPGRLTRYKGIALLITRPSGDFDDDGIEVDNWINSVESAILPEFRSSSTASVTLKSVRLRLPPHTSLVTALDISHAHAREYRETKSCRQTPQTEFCPFWRILRLVRSVTVSRDGNLASPNSLIPFFYCVRCAGFEAWLRWLAPERSSWM